MKIRGTRHSARSIAAAAFIALSAILATPDRANAQTNICGTLLQDLVLPVSSIKCVDYSLICVATPQCCIPGACLVDPLCVTMKVATETMELFSQGEIYCDFSPQDAVDRWLRREVLLGVDLLTGPPLLDTLLAVVDANIAALSAGSRPLSDSTKAELRKLAAPLSGDGSYSSGDIERVRFVPASYGNAAMFLRDKVGITLGDLVVLRDDLFQALFDAASTLESFQWDASWGRWGRPGLGYAIALSVAAHELIHVAQYRRYGANEFRTTYIIDALVNDYDGSAYEAEAYQFQADIGMASSGPFCELAPRILVGMPQLSGYAWRECPPYPEWTGVMSVLLTGG